MDVISSHQAGVKQAVATSGTAMTEQHLKALSRLTSDVRLAYDGDDAGVRATERAINLAGSLGINLSVISDYHGAKDPDELIQKGAELWQEAVAAYEPAVDWLLKKYEEKLDMFSAQGKKEYSDVAMRVISYLTDPVERKHYEQKVAERLDVSVEDLRAKKISETEFSRRRLKKVKGGGVNADKVKVLEDNLLSIMLFGGEAGASINLPVPEDEVKMEELAMIYENKFSKESAADLKAEVKEMLSRYEKERILAEISELSVKAEGLEEEGGEGYEKIMRKIGELTKKIK